MSGALCQRQAAYRERCAAALRSQCQAKGLPALPPIPAMPGTVRWRATVRTAHELLDIVCDEMRTYADDRSEQWRESERAEEFEEQLTGIEEVHDTLYDYC
jgi:hypothetical protein